MEDSVSWQGVSGKGEKNEDSYSQEDRDRGGQTEDLRAHCRKGRRGDPVRRGEDKGFPGGYGGMACGLV